MTPVTVGTAYLRREVNRIPVVCGRADVALARRAEAGEVTRAFQRAALQLWLVEI
jgi:hypothetical protein